MTRQQYPTQYLDTQNSRKESQTSLPGTSNSSSLII
uniref:Uncharacterized protein n=1 Tax=Anguilla anguilla TaxID=7936 RepID=A0A0E9TFB8_ANGAN